MLLNKKMISLTVDGKKIQIEEGATILEACEKAGSRVPTLCYDKRLLPYGACRLCIVEVEGSRAKFTTSCSTPAEEGMVVNTTSDDIIQRRKTILQLILLNHPLDCLICDKAGECKLQDLVYEYSVVDNPFRSRWQYIEFHIDHVSPFIERNTNRCILCGRCVRICDELTGTCEVSFIRRGIKTDIGTDFNRPLNCEFCGQCISTCPTGALSSKLFKYKARVWELKDTASICSYCSHGCTVIISSMENTVKRIEGDVDIGINEGNLCARGRFGFGYIHSEERLNTPLIKDRDIYRKVSWEEAIDFVVSRLKGIKENYGPDSIAGLASARLTNEELYLFQKFMRVGIGTNNIDHSLGYNGLLKGLKESFGLPSATNSIHEIRKSDVIFLIGTDPTASIPLIKQGINLALKRNNAKLLIANPFDIKLTKQAKVSVVYRPGTEVALLNAIAWVIINKKLMDESFISSSTLGFDDFSKHISKYTPEYAQEITGIDKEAIIELARLYATAKSATILVGSNLIYDDEKLAKQSANLALLTGNIGRENAGVCILLEKNNSQGALDMGVLPNFLPGYQNLTEPVIREKFEKLWGRPLPRNEGMNTELIFSQIEKDKIKALYILGEDVVRSYPGSYKIEELLSKVDLLVIHSLFMTETAKSAHVILPCASFAEKDGTYTSIERRVQLAKRAIEPVGQAKPDWEIISLVSSQLGYEMNYPTPKEIMEEITTAVPIYREISYEKLSPSGIQWPYRTKSNAQTEYLYADGFGENKAKFIPVEFEKLSELEKQNIEYPFILIPYNLFLHSGTLSTYVKELNDVAGESFILLNHKEADKLELEEEAEVIVRSRYNQIKTRLKLSWDVPLGVVLIPIHYKDGSQALLPPFYSEPKHRLCPVRIDKYEK
ncbi:TPA: formate dehydrogenase subunit alpha [bacterium]|nr:formate dehydrogenase subunit alpha [bacterium]